MGVKQKTGSAIRALVGSWRSWLLLGLCSGELGTRWGKCPGVGPVAPVDLSGGRFPGLGRTGSPGLAGLVLGPGHPLGLQRPLPASSCECAGKACVQRWLLLTPKDPASHHPWPPARPGQARTPPSLLLPLGHSLPRRIPEGSVPSSRSGSCSWRRLWPSCPWAPLPLAAGQDVPRSRPAGIASLSAS